MFFICNHSFDLSLAAQSIWSDYSRIQGCAS